MRVYLLLMLVAAAVTFLMTPAARWVALRTGAISAVRARDVHSVPTPRAGGLAMMTGLIVAVLIGSRMPFLQDVFTGPQAFGILGGALIVCLLGWADDVWDLDWLTKLAGQILAAGFMAFQQVQLITFPTPGYLTIPSSRLSLIVTVLVVVIAMNAVNFVDGLDGLAAGIVAIGGTAFFLYTYRLTWVDTPENLASLAAVMMAVLVGVCVGFLPHNFFPSRIFMGDSGSMVLGLVMSGAAITITGNVKPDVMTGTVGIPALFPLLLPVAVIMLPLTDMGMAVVRRLAAGKSPMAPDRLHLHHRMLALGHSHRRAVLILYVWTAVFAFSAAALVEWDWPVVMACTAAAVVVAVVVTAGPLRHRGRFLDDDAALERAAAEPVPEPVAEPRLATAHAAPAPLPTTTNEESNA